MDVAFQLRSHFLKLVSCKLKQLSMIGEIWFPIDTYVQSTGLFASWMFAWNWKSRYVCILFSCVCFSEILPLKTFLWFKFPVSPLSFRIEIRFRVIKIPNFIHDIPISLKTKLIENKGKSYKFIFIALKWWIFVIKILWNKFPLKYNLYPNLEKAIIFSIPFLLICHSTVSLFFRSLSLLNYFITHQ